MGEVEQFLVATEKLYTYLMNIPSDDERTEYIEQINILLDARGETIEALGEIDVSQHPLFARLSELDKGIQKRLKEVMNLVKTDIKGLQQKKRHESSYTNPYAATQTIDGMYFDNKK